MTKTKFDNNHSKISIIVAVDDNNAIGRGGDLLCHLPNDLKHFKRVTEGHTVIMGRRTFESLPKGSLPNRTNIVITSGKAESFPKCLVARSLQEAFELCTDDNEPFIIGGGQLYRTTFPMTNTLYLTQIHHAFDDADTFFPEIDFDEWTLVEKEEHRADERHKYNYTFLKYVRKE